MRTRPTTSSATERDHGRAYRTIGSLFRTIVTIIRTVITIFHAVVTLMGTVVTLFRTVVTIIRTGFTIFPHLAHPALSLRAARPWDRVPQPVRQGHLAQRPRAVVPPDDRTAPPMSERGAPASSGPPFCFAFGGARSLSACGRFGRSGQARFCLREGSRPSLRRGAQSGTVARGSVADARQLRRRQSPFPVGCRLSVQSGAGRCNVGGGDQGSPADCSLIETSSGASQ